MAVVPKGLLHGPLQQLHTPLYGFDNIVTILQKEEQALIDRYKTIDDEILRHIVRNPWTDFSDSLYAKVALLYHPFTRYPEKERKIVNERVGLLKEYGWIERRPGRQGWQLVPPGTGGLTTRE